MADDLRNCDAHFVQCGAAGTQVNLIETLSNGLAACDAKLSVHRKCVLAEVRVGPCGSASVGKVFPGLRDRPTGPPGRINPSEQPHA